MGGASAACPVQRQSWLRLTEEAFGSGDSGVSAVKAWGPRVLALLASFLPAKKGG